MLGFIGLGDYWDAEDVGDGEKDSRPQICGLSKSMLVPFTKVENTAAGDGHG